MSVTNYTCRFHFDLDIFLDTYSFLLPLFLPSSLWSAHTDFCRKHQPGCLRHKSLRHSGHRSVDRQVLVRRAIAISTSGLRRSERIHLILEDFVIFSEGEHLHREAFGVGRDWNPGVACNRMENGHVAVVRVLTTCEGIGFKCFSRHTLH